MAKSEFDRLFILVSVLMCCSGLVIIGGGYWMVEDYQAVTETADQIKDDLEKVKDVDMMDTSKDYYSVFNKKGGWMNMAYVMLGVGAVTVAVALLGFIGVQKETVFLLLTYIVLLMIIIMLQIASVLIIIKRDNEVKDLKQITYAKGSFEDIFKFEEKFFFFVFSLSFSTLVLNMSVGITLARQVKRKVEKRR